ncbi:hypothetical protein BDZ89DRAFT_1045878 [Hymenopellis radicata]|nr:hypothetical protein BDZ89DRAFT_1045878 [Hymenopellis radicata]
MAIKRRWTGCGYHYGPRMGEEGCMVALEIWIQNTHHKQCRRGIDNPSITAKVCLKLTRCERDSHGMICCAQFLVQRDPASVQEVGAGGLEVSASRPSAQAIRKSSYHGFLMGKEVEHESKSPVSYKVEVADPGNGARFRRGFRSGFDVVAESPYNSERVYQVGLALNEIERGITARQSTSQTRAALASLQDLRRRHQAFTMTISIVLASFNDQTFAHELLHLEAEILRIQKRACQTCLRAEALEMASKVAGQLWMRWILPKSFKCNPWDSAVQERQKPVQASTQQANLKQTFNSTIDKSNLVQSRPVFGGVCQQLRARDVNKSSMTLAALKAFKRSLTDKEEVKSNILLTSSIHDYLPPRLEFGNRDSYDIPTTAAETTRQVVIGILMLGFLDTRTGNSLTASGLDGACGVWRAT